MIDLGTLEELTRGLGRTIGAALPNGVGFTLLLYDFGPGGNLTYISNAQREDMIKTLREMANKLERRSPPETRS